MQKYTEEALFTQRQPQSCYKESTNSNNRNLDEQRVCLNLAVRVLFIQQLSTKKTNAEKREYRRGLREDTWTGVSWNLSFTPQVRLPVGTYDDPELGQRRWLSVLWWVASAHLARNAFSTLSLVPNAPLLLLSFPAPMLPNLQLSGGKILPKEANMDPKSSMTPMVLYSHSEFPIVCSTALTAICHHMSMWGLICFMFA